MFSRIGKTKTLFIATLIALGVFVGLNADNIALAAGPGEVNIAGWPLCPGMKYTSPGEMRLKIYNPDTTSEQALAEPGGSLHWIRFNGTDPSALFGGSFSMTGEGNYTVVMISGNQRVANTVKLYAGTDQPRPDNFCSGPSVGIEPTAPPPTEAEEEVAEEPPVEPDVEVEEEPVTDADAQVHPDNTQRARVRSGPGLDYERLASLEAGTYLSKIAGRSGKDADGFVWYQHEFGWTREDLIKLINVDLDDLDVVEVAPPAAEEEVEEVTEVVTDTVTLTSGYPVDSLCYACWEISIESPVVTDTIRGGLVQVANAITLTYETTVVVPANDSADLLIYVEHMTILKADTGTAVEQSAVIKDRGVKYTVQDGDTVRGIISKVRGENWGVTAEEILKLVTENPDAFETGIDGGNIVIVPVPGAEILFGCPALG